MMTRDKQSVALILGPESSGTRIYTDILSSHPDVMGSNNSLNHDDILDPIWGCIRNDKIDEAIKKFPEFDENLLVTRRSLPHADPREREGNPANFMEFPDVSGFVEVCEKMGLNVWVLITVRSPSANLSSWVFERASANNSIEDARHQYEHSYRYVFRIIANRDLSFRLLPLEALVLDGENYINTIFDMLNLTKVSVDYVEKEGVNIKRHKAFRYIDRTSNLVPTLRKHLYKVLRYLKS